MTPLPASFAGIASQTCWTEILIHDACNVVYTNVSFLPMCVQLVDVVVVVVVAAAVHATLHDAT